MIAGPMSRSTGREQLAQRLLQALREVVDVVRDAAQQVAARLLVDVAERQHVDLVLDVGAQLDISRWMTPARRYDAMSDRSAETPQTPSAWLEQRGAGRRS